MLKAGVPKGLRTETSHTEKKEIPDKGMKSGSWKCYCVSELDPDDLFDESLSRLLSFCANHNCSCKQHASYIPFFSRVYIKKWQKHTWDFSATPPPLPYVPASPPSLFDSVILVGHDLLFGYYKLVPRVVWVTFSTSCSTPASKAQAKLNSVVTTR